MHLAPFVIDRYDHTARTYDRSQNGDDLFEMGIVRSCRFDSRKGIFQIRFRFQPVCVRKSEW